MATSATSLERRPAIDGLRGVAILMVVAFHAHVPGFGGGFAGVDVFFVISGFLITRLLLRELDSTGTISFASFYARRARRLLPALGTLLIAMALFAWPLAPSAEERRGLATSIMAAAAFSANLLYYRRAQDYFADTSRPDPLTHTWSLSVEEQFYLVWPALLLIAAFISRRLRLRWMPLAVLVAVGIASFASACLSTSNPDWVFYAPTSRIWELATGAVLAYAVENGRLRIGAAGAMGNFGIVAILSSAALLDSTASTHPWRLLLPTIGAAAILLSLEVTKAPLVQRLLTYPALEYVGKVSYGWYLWHFPALVIMRGYLQVPWATALAIVWSLCVAVLSYRLLEEPIRSRRYAFAANDRLVLSGAAGSLLVILFTGMGLKYQASTSRDLFRGHRSDIAWIQSRCPNLSLHDVLEGRVCPLGSADTTVSTIVVMGDSHASRFSALFDEFGKRAGIRVSVASLSRCAPLADYSSPSNREAPECTRQVDSVIATLRSTSSRVSGVALIARWTQVFGNAPRDTMAQQAYYMLPESSRSVRIGRDAYAALRRTAGLLAAAGVRTLLVAQPPEWSGDPSHCNASATSDCVARRSDIKAHEARSLMALREMRSTSSAVRLLELDRFFCDEKFCSPIRRGVRAYDDSHHLSIEGALGLMDDVWDDLSWLAGVKTRAPTLVNSRS